MPPKKSKPLKNQDKNTTSVNKEKTESLKNQVKNTVSISKEIPSKVPKASTWVGVIVSVVIVLVAVAITAYSSSNSIKSSKSSAVKEKSSAKATKSNGNIIDKVAKQEATAPRQSNAEGIPIDGKLDSDCVDRYAECKMWKRQGGCKEAPGFFSVNCPKTCKYCHFRDPKVRCDYNHLNITENPIYAAGDLSRMFTDLTSRFPDITIHSKDPWIVTFDNFLSEDELDAMVSNIRKWERSTDIGVENEFGERGRKLSEIRTSSNSWCEQECENDIHIKQVYKKIENVTFIPRSHYENLQILRYEVGQSYSVHHDMTIEDRSLPGGPRILTFFFYISDVEEGGETYFPALGISIKPKRGRALLWPSVLDSGLLYTRDERTIHEAKPVIKGLKFAANAWIHSRDYVKADLWGCTGRIGEPIPV